MMRKLCPNFDREDGLETVLEVPIPEEMFTSMGSTVALRWQNMATWMKAQTPDKWSSPIIAGRYNELSFLLFVVGSPLIPFQVQVEQPAQRPVRHSSIAISSLTLSTLLDVLVYHKNIKQEHQNPRNHRLREEIEKLKFVIENSTKRLYLPWLQNHLVQLEASTAKYIVQQYMAATGGPAAMNSLQSMCALGQVKISASDFHQGDETVNVRSTEEAGGFVLWQKNPDLWCLELLVSGCKVISGSNGKISWRQSSNQQTPITKGTPRPLRRFLQGLDPRATANLFLDAVCIGEKIINDEDCFILKLDTSKSALESQSGPKFEIIHHTIWGYFSQRSGLLVKFEDSRLLAVKKDEDDGDGIFWETSAETVIEDYKYVDGVNIAHGGKTSVTVYRYGEQSSNHRRVLEERWKIEEVDFNVWGLKNDFFMPPSGLKI